MTKTTKHAAPLLGAALLTESQQALEHIHHSTAALTVVITHNAAMAAMADRVLYLSDGQIIKETRNEQRLPVTSLEW